MEQTVSYLSRIYTVNITYVLFSNNITYELENTGINLNFSFIIV